MHYKELDKQILDGIPKNTKEINDKVKNYIINERNLAQLEAEISKISR